MGFYIAFCSLIVIMIIYPIIFLHFGEDYTVFQFYFNCSHLNGRPLNICCLPFSDC